MSRKPPKFEALVVNAIRRLQAAQGSTATEIANYLSQEYNVSGPEIRKMIQLTIRRGVNYGILQKLKRGFVTCDRHVPETMEPMDMGSASCFDCKMRGRRHGSRQRGLRGRGRKRVRGRKRGRSRGRRHRGRSRGRGARRRGRRHGLRGSRSRIRKVRSIPERRKPSPRRRMDKVKTRQQPIAERLQRKRVKKNVDGGEQTAQRVPNSPARARSTSKSPMRPANNDDKHQET